MNKINWDEWEECEGNSKAYECRMLIEPNGETRFFKRKAKTMFGDEYTKIKIGQGGFVLTQRDDNIVIGKKESIQAILDAVDEWKRRWGK